MLGLLPVSYQFEQATIYSYHHTSRWYPLGNCKRLIEKLKRKRGPTSSFNKSRFPNGVFLKHRPLTMPTSYWNTVKVPLLKVSSLASGKYNAIIFVSLLLWSNAQIRVSNTNILVWHSYIVNIILHDKFDILLLSWHCFGGCLFLFRDNIYRQQQATTTTHLDLLASVSTRT